MGEIRTKVVCTNAVDQANARRDMIPADQVRRVEVEMVADTGAVLVLLPQEMTEALGLDSFGKSIVVLANDQRIELQRVGPLAVTLAGRTAITECLVGPPGCTPLLGQIVLESLDLIVDPLKQRVTVRPESPFLPTLMLK